MDDSLQITILLSFLTWYVKIQISNNTSQREKQTEIAEMASMTMTASFLAGSTITKQPLTAPRRGLIVAKASNGERVNVEMKNKEEESVNGRRDLVFAAAAAAAAISFGKVAMADDEPQRGSPEAKKKYGPICVTMPTARICRK
ncbi:photosystem II 5 kDa protein, chloroplastic [Euphorbia lathyris]|uniref:photosystem II 5 kDa protein, chloroplastic n=1 Tax=Euphorbia lathyris TaxID=212925 RepID=UPI0033131952